MKRYELWAEWNNGELEADDARESEDGQWVPAEVAQALYDALTQVANRLDANDCDEWTLHALKTKASEAISLADGESSESDES